jgi:hypothetical protein
MYGLLYDCSLAAGLRGPTARHNNMRAHADITPGPEPDATQSAKANAKVAPEIEEQRTRMQSGTELTGNDPGTQ